MSLKKLLFFVCIAAVGAAAAGCTRPAGNTTAPGANQVAADGHSHDGWWCDEHGVPEEICALCNVKLVAAFKAKGDWCQEHDRPDSQCFVCHPEKEAAFAAQYEAKYGKQPPKPEGGEEKHAGRSEAQKS
jgi:hypothetical protein